MKRKKMQDILLIATIVSMSVYLIWRLFFTLPFQEGWFALLMGILLIASEIIASLGTFELFWRKKEESVLELPDIPVEWYPHVDVFIATHNESVELLYNTVNAATFMDYPDPRKVHIYLCDDSNRIETADLAKKLGIGYLGLENNKDAKSGNLNHALSKTDSPLVVTFDADMIPRSSFLMKSIPYFFLPELKKNGEGVWMERENEEKDKDERIGFVQTPQSFYNPDLFQYNLFSETSIPNEQDFFTKEINVMRNQSNSVAYTGSNTVLLRKALEDIGGFPTDTITEDFETGIKIQSEGYTSLASEEVLANGLAPTSIKELISQRIRWARGVIQSIHNCRVPFNKKLPISSRISYMVSYSYWWSFSRRLIFMLAPILFALFDVQVAVTGFWPLLLFWLPSHALYSAAMRLLSSDTRNQRWSQINETILAPYMIIPVILETIGIKQMKFRVTNKDNQQNTKSERSIYALPQVLLLGLSVAALFRFTYGKYGSELVFGSVIIFWLVYNMINLMYALFFLLGRTYHRAFERIKASERVEIHFDNHIILAQTVDLSEGGFAFVLDHPDYIPSNQSVSFEIKNERYQANLEGKVLHVKEMEKKWIYGIQLTMIDDENLRQYRQLVYDRMHSLPQKLNVWMTAFDDLLNNMNKRVEKEKLNKRATPRIPLNKTLTFENGTQAVVRDFNYQYARISALSKQVLQRELVFVDEKGMRIEFLSVENEGISHGKQKKKEKQKFFEKVYKIVNWQELTYNKEFISLIDSWSEDYDATKSVN